MVTLGLKPEYGPEYHYQVGEVSVRTLVDAWREIVRQGLQPSAINYVRD